MAAVAAVQAQEAMRQDAAIQGAGHQGNTDYLFERREIPGRVP